MATFSELLTRANTIKNEVVKKANTAIRVGSWMVDLLVWISATFATKSQIEQKKQEYTVAFNAQNEFSFTHEVTEPDTMYVITENWRGEYGEDKDFHVEYMGLPTGVIKFHSYYPLEQGEKFAIYFK